MTISNIFSCIIAYFLGVIQRKKRNILEHYHCLPFKMVIKGQVVRNIVIDTKYVRDRITQLRLQKGVSEYQMSYDLGHSRSYVYNISSGKSLPPMAEFLQICDYFEITPSQFFDASAEKPAFIQAAVEELGKLDDDDLTMVMKVLKRLNRE